MAAEAKFHVLNNQTIGRNLATFRKLRDKKAWEVAEHVGLKEASYTKYERGENKITIHLIQKVAEYLKIDPIRIILTQPEHYTECIDDPMKAMHTIQTDAIIKTLKTLTQMNEALRQILEYQINPGSSMDKA